MPRATVVKQYNTFTKGLVTEASPLTFPENASLDEDNFVLKRTGARERRLGIDYETGYALTATGLAQTVIDSGKQSYHKWENPGGDTTVSIGVVRIYNKLWFVDLLKSAPSNNLLNGGNPITISGLSNSDIDIAIINTELVIVSSELVDPVKLLYNLDTKMVSQATFPILIRDLYGVDDGLEVDTRPSNISETHRYNLKNQGWSPKISSICGFDSIDCTATYTGTYPSNADIWTLGKVGDATSANFEKYDPLTLVRNSIDNAYSAKGSFIIYAFSRGYDRQAKAGIPALLPDRETGRITTVAAYAGRVFYSGVASHTPEGDSRSPNYSGYIFFSQIVNSPDKLGKCYQEADPTSPLISDIIDTDGGTIQIPEITRIYKLVSIGSSLLVFAENGVWEVFGDTNGFTATSYQANKVSSNGCSSPRSVVNSGNTIFAWTKAGIYVYSQVPATGRYAGENLSLLTIQSLYTSLSEVSKNNAKGIYDEKENRVRWLYNDQSTYPGTLSVTRYNRELVLDLTLEAFYSNSVLTTTPYIADYIDVPNYTVTSTDESVFAASNEVLVGAVQVVVTTDATVSRITQFSLLTIVGTSFTFSKYNNRVFVDWFTYNGVGVGFRSFLLTGYELFSDILRTKQVPYIWFYFERTEDGFSDSGGNLIIDNPSGCLVSSQWNWTDSANSGKWGTAFQAYRFNRPYIPTGPADTFDYGYNVIVTKSKIRGSGRSLSLLIESEAGKDMKLLGWANLVSGGATP